VAIWQSLADEAEVARDQIFALTKAQAERRGLPREPGAGAALVLAPRGDTVSAALGRELPLTDLVVVGQSSASAAGLWAGPLGEALMDAKSPVLVARGDVPPAGRPAAVAWDGSFGAARAVKAATPLLQDASEVVILQDPDEADVRADSGADPARLAAYLQARGVANVRTCEAHGRKIGGALLASAEAAGAALLVAGAYGHSRLGEALFGGATRALLEAKTGPHLLISH
jgi:nucleotide-binding universal stress UspA family protein